MKKSGSSLAVVLLAVAGAAPLGASAIRLNVVTSNSGVLGRTDDGSTRAISLGIDGASGIDFYGVAYTQIYINNNGNVTFSSALHQFTPNAFASGVGQAIIAPFFADVDTWGSNSSVVNYGNGLVDGRDAFIVNWPGVGYYNAASDKLNAFQLILIDRSDTGAGNFDIEFNYDRIQWESGSASGGVDGLGGASAVVGFSNGLSGLDNLSMQLPGSTVDGALLDSGPAATSLVRNSLNSQVLGRYDFYMRSGSMQVSTLAETPEPRSILLLIAPLLILGGESLRRRRMSGQRLARD
jgi:hypothetical protein